MGFAMLLALPAMLFLGTLIDVSTAEEHDSAAPDAPDPATGQGDLLDDPN